MKKGPGNNNHVRDCEEHEV